VTSNIPDSNVNTTLSEQLKLVSQLRLVLLNHFSAWWIFKPFTPLHSLALPPMFIDLWNFL